MSIDYVSTILPHGQLKKNHLQPRFVPLASMCDLPLYNSIDLEELIYKEIFQIYNFTTVGRI